jgi:hypothetical protein
VVSIDGYDIEKETFLRRVDNSHEVSNNPIRVELEVNSLSARATADQ